MADPKHDPLAWRDWSQALDRLVDRLAFGDETSDVDAVRRLVELISRAPHPDLVEGLVRPDPAMVDRLLRAGAAEAVALRLVGERSGFFASRGASGEYLVSVLLFGYGPEVTASGASLARAVICALALALIEPEHPGRTGLPRGACSASTLH